MSASGPGIRKGAEEAVRESELIDALAQSAFLTMGLLTKLAADNDLSLTQLRVLAILRDRRLRMSDLVDHLGLEKSTLTGLVARAEKRRLVGRTQNAADGRAVDVFLTEEGLALSRRLTAELVGHVRPSTGVLTSAEQERLSFLLGKVAAHAAPTHAVGPAGIEPTTSTV